MINYLTETKPYLGTSWVWIYGTENFSNHLLRAEKMHPLPVVVSQKCQPIGGNWLYPDLSDKYVNNYLYKGNRQLCFDSFISNNSYKIVWENEIFKIYLPPKK